MQRAGIEGTVVLKAIVDRTGRAEARSARVVHASHRAFEGPAIRLVERSLFRPGRVRRRAVRIMIRLPVRFQLHHR